MGEDEDREVSEVEKSINAWRQSERKIMIETIQDLIQTSHKYAKSQYTPNAQRARWTKLAGQLIWYKDQILKNFSLEALTIEFQALQRQVMESEKRRDLESRTGNYPTIIFQKPGDNRPEEGQNKKTSEGPKDGDPEGAKEVA